MHMRDQLSFTQVPKKYINATKKKKLKKLRSKKLVEIKKNIFSIILKRGSLVPMSFGFLFHNLGAVNARSLSVFYDFLLS